MTDALMTPAEHIEHANGYAWELIRYQSADLEEYLKDSVESFNAADMVAITELMAFGDGEVEIRPAGTPRTWDLPAEPSCDLTDRDGDRWIPAGSHWDCPVHEIVGVPWPELICDYSPLTAAPAEAVPPC